MRRVLDFENGLIGSVATRIEPFRWGVAPICDRFPAIWDLNHLRADTDLETASAEALMEEAERILDSGGFAHRQVRVDDEAAAARMKAGFKSANWTFFRALYMVLHRDPDRRPAPGLAGEVPWEEVRPVAEAELRSERFVRGEDAVQQHLALREHFHTVSDVRHFGVRNGERVVSVADLYSDGVFAQVEDVATLEESRNRGYARAAVLAAADTALAERHEVVFIVADHDDWPKTLYKRIGFDAVGIVHWFRRPPPALAEAVPE